MIGIIPAQRSHARQNAENSPRKSDHLGGLTWRMPIKIKPGAKEASPFAVCIAGRLARRGLHSAVRTAPHHNGCCLVSGLCSGRLPDGCGRSRWKNRPLEAQTKYIIACARVPSANHSLSVTIVDSKSRLWTIPPIWDGTVQPLCTTRRTRRLPYYT